VFIPVNQCLVTQATWTVSFILDLQIYDDFVETLDDDIRVTEDALGRIKKQVQSGRLKRLSQSIYELNIGVGF